jgi:hypothetical protein
MSEQPREKIERLELNRETVRDLTEEEAENVLGASALCLGGGRTVVSSLPGGARPSPLLGYPQDPVAPAEHLAVLDISGYEISH